MALAIPLGGRDDCLYPTQEEMLRGVKCLAQGRATGKGSVGLEHPCVCKAPAPSPNSAGSGEGRRAAEMGSAR